jgi:hypothetical protein
MARKFTNERAEQEYEDDDSPSKESGWKTNVAGRAQELRFWDRKGYNVPPYKIKKEKRRRDAKRQHPRNVSEQYTLEEWMGIMQEMGMDVGNLGRLVEGLGLTTHDVTPSVVNGTYTLDEWLDLMEGANQILSEQESHMAEQYTLEEWMGKKPKRKLKKRSLHEAGPRFDVRDTDDMPDPLDRGEPKFSFKDAVKRAADKDYPADYTPVFYGGSVDDTHTLEEWMGMLDEAGYSLMDEQYTLEELIGLMTEAGGDAEEIKRLTKALEDAMKARGPASSMLDIKEKLKALQTARKAAKQKSAMTEQYTIEEWMGMLDEMGYGLSEYSLWRPKENNAKSTGVVTEPKKQKEPKEPKRKKKKEENKSTGGDTPDFTYLSRYLGAGLLDGMDEKDARKAALKAVRGAKVNEGNKENKAKKNATYDAVGKGMDPHGVSNTPTRRLGRDVTSRLQSIKDNPDRKVKLPESISENTVARLQELAGIQPLNG